MSVRAYAGRVMQATPAGERIVCIGRIAPPRHQQRVWTISTARVYQWPERRS